MSSPEQVEQTEEDWAWRLVKRKDSNSASLELGELYSDAPDEVVNALLHVIGESLIKAGTIMLRSRLDVGDEDADWDEYDDD